MTRSMNELGLRGLPASVALAACVAGCSGVPPEADRVDAGVAKGPATGPGAGPDPGPFRPPAAAIDQAAPAGDAAGDSDEAKFFRDRLMDALVADGDVRDPRVIAAMRAVPRHLYATFATLDAAYRNVPYPIGFDQTISQPTVVGMMTEALALTGREKVLEIGTGSGYQAAILARLAAKVFTIELLGGLGEAARERLAQHGYDNIVVRVGDGYAGWPEHAPFDRVLVTAAPPEIPPKLLEQLADGGILVAPVGPEGQAQRLVRIRKQGRELIREELGLVRFVPMVKGSADPNEARP